MNTNEERIPVLAVDPGDTTGWFMAWVQPGEFDVSHPSRFIVSPSWGLVDTFEGLRDIYEWTFQRAKYVVVEDYVVYPAYALQHTGSHLNTAQILGVCEWLAWKAGATRVLQLAILARNHWPVSRIRKYLPKLMMYPSTPTPKTKGALGSHEVSALRHWLTFTERKKWITFNLIRGEDIV